MQFTHYDPQIKQKNEKSCTTSATLGTQNEELQQHYTTKASHVLVTPPSQESAKFS